MKRLFLIAILIGCSTMIFAQNNQQVQDMVEVSARVDRDVLPDEIYLHIAINEKDNKGKISVDKQEKDMIRALSSLGINVKDALTVNSMVSTLKSNTLKKDNILVSRDYTLKVSTAQLASDAIESLNSIGVAWIGLSKTSVSESLEKEIKNQLLKEAAQKAKENADIMAHAVGSKAGKAIYMQNNYRSGAYSNGIMLRDYSAAKSAASQEEQPVSLTISKQNISVEVFCKFQLISQ